MTADDDQSIFARVADGTDPGALGVFYDRHERAVLAYFVARTRDPEVAADLCAETFAQALISIGRFQPDKGSPVQWLFGIAERQLSQHFRCGAVEDRARRKLGLLPLAYSPSQYEAIAALEGEIRVEVLLDGLPAKQAAAVRARVLDGESYADIAAAQHTSEQSVRQRVSRGLSALRPRLRRETS